MTLTADFIVMQRLTVHRSTFPVLLGLLPKDCKGSFAFLGTFSKQLRKAAVSFLPLQKLDCLNRN
jgi:hypothetical protein